MIYVSTTGQEFRNRAEFLRDVEQRFAKYPDVIALIRLIERLQNAATGSKVGGGVAYTGQNMDVLADLLDERSKAATNAMRGVGPRARELYAREVNTWKSAAAILRCCSIDPDVGA